MFLFTYGEQSFQFLGIVFTHVAVTEVFDENIYLDHVWLFGYQHRVSAVETSRRTSDINVYDYILRTHDKRRHIII